MPGPQRAEHTLQPSRSKTAAAEPMDTGGGNDDGGGGGGGGGGVRESRRDVAEASGLMQTSGRSCSRSARSTDSLLSSRVAKMAARRTATCAECVDRRRSNRRALARCLHARTMWLKLAFRRANASDQKEPGRLVGLTAIATRAAKEFATLQSSLSTSAQRTQHCNGQARAHTWRVFDRRPPPASKDSAYVRPCSRVQCMSHTMNAKNHLTSCAVAFFAELVKDRPSLVCALSTSLQALFLQGFSGE